MIAGSGSVIADVISLMDEATQSESPYQLTITCLLLVIAGVALILGLAQWWRDGGGLALALSVAILPFAIIIDIVAQKTWKLDLPTWRQMLFRSAIALLLAFILAVFAWLAFYDQNSWWSPVPMLLFLTYGYMEPYLTESPLSQFYIYSIASVVFLVTVFPIFTRSKITRLPVRSLVLLSTATLTSIYWFSASFESAFEHQSSQYIYGTLIANFSFACFLWAYCMLSRSISCWPCANMESCSFVLAVLGRPSLAWIVHLGTKREITMRCTRSRTCACLFLLADLSFRLGDRCRYSA